MKTEPVDAAEVPPVFNFNRGEETGDSNRSISDLIDDLRTAFQSSVFDRVQDILVAKEEKLKREIGRMKEEVELTRESLGIALLQKAEAEEELKSFMAKCAKNMEAMRVKTTAAEERAKSAEERAKRSEERYEKLLSEVKKAESEKSSNLVELKKKNGELEIAKMKAEEELKVWNRKFAELEPRVTKLESDTMEIRIAENRGSLRYLYCLRFQIVAFLALNSGPIVLNSIMPVKHELLGFLHWRYLRSGYRIVCWSSPS